MLLIKMVLTSIGSYISELMSKRTFSKKYVLFPTRARFVIVYKSSNKSAEVDFETVPGRVSFGHIVWAAWASPEIRQRI